MRSLQRPLLTYKNVRQREIQVQTVTDAVYMNTKLNPKEATDVSPDLNDVSVTFCSARMLLVSSTFRSIFTSAAVIPF